jgi:hypothetical protein
MISNRYTLVVLHVKISNCKHMSKIRKSQSGETEIFCTSCQRWGHETLYYPVKKNLSGRSGVCIECRRDQIKAYQINRKLAMAKLREELGLPPKEDYRVGRPIHPKRRELLDPGIGYIPENQRARLVNPRADYKEPTRAELEDKTTVAPSFQELFNLGGKKD